ncbi:MAG: cupredoxin domain-containing protein [Actinomycetota bacterium]
MTDRSPTPRVPLLPAIVIPLVCLVFIAIVLWTFSRVLLQLSHTAATATALAVAVGILAVAAFVASRKHVGSGAVVSMIGGVFGVTMLAGGVALLVGQPTEGEGEAVIVAISAPEGAAVNGYSTTTLDAPADVPFTIAFDNQDPGIQHNVAIAEEEGSPPFFEGTLVAGPIQTEYPVEPVPAADYFFFCTAHPTTMTGTLKVAEGAEPGGGGGAGEGPPTVVAKSLTFDTDTIALPSEVESPLVLDNEDPGTQHNLSIYTDDTAAEPLFEGEIFEGVAEQTYTIPPLAAGEYYFRCDVHPTMEGTVVVETREGEGGGGDGGPPSGSPPGG